VGRADGAAPRDTPRHESGDARFDQASRAGQASPR
jgi:hypothetical protein